jgi:hypothetical protein
MPIFSEELQTPQSAPIPVIDVAKNKVAGIGIYNSLTDVANIAGAFRTLGYVAIVIGGTETLVYVFNGATVDDWSEANFIQVGGAPENAPATVDFEYPITGDIQLMSKFDLDNGVIDNTTSGNIDDYYLILNHQQTSFAKPIGDFETLTTPQKVDAYNFSYDSPWQALIANTYYGDNTKVVSRAILKITASIGPTAFVGKYANAHSGLNSWLGEDTAAATEFQAGSWGTNPTVELNAWLTNLERSLGYSDPMPGGNYSPSLHYVGDVSGSKVWGAINPGVTNLKDAASWTAITGEPFMISATTLGFLTTSTNYATINNVIDLPGRTVAPAAYLYASETGYQDLTLNGTVGTLGDLDNIRIALSVVSSAFKDWYESWVEAVVQDRNNPPATAGLTLPIINYRGTLHIQA